MGATAPGSDKSSAAEAASGGPTRLELVLAPRVVAIEETWWLMKWYLEHKGAQGDQRRERGDDAEG